MREIRKCLYVNEMIQEGMERSERERKKGVGINDGGERGEGAVVISSRKEPVSSAHVEGLALDEYGQLFYPGVRDEKV